MKKSGLILSFILIILSFVFFSCAKNENPAGPEGIQQTEVFVEEAGVAQCILSLGASGSVEMLAWRVILKEGDAAGNSLTGAAVNMAGVVLTESPAGSGIYVPGISGEIDEDVNVNLNITSSAGNVSSDLNAPRWAEITAPLPAIGQKYSAASGIDVQWSYPGNIPPDRR